MSAIFRLVFAGIAAVLLAGSAFAAGIDLGTHDSSAPVSVSADDFSGNLTTRAGTYRGNVIVAQGNFKLRADTVEVTTVKGAIDRIVASGHVLFDSPRGQARGDKGVYLLGPRTVTLTGDVLLTRAKNVMRGTELVVNLQSGKAELTAHGARGGRVTSSFTPPAKGEADKPVNPGDEKPK